MNKKDWKERLASVEKILESAKTNEKRAKEDQEDDYKNNTRETPWETLGVLTLCITQIGKVSMVDL